MKTIPKLAVSLVFLVAVNLGSSLKVSDAQSLPAACPNPDARFLTGPEFLKNESMTLEGIRQFLRDKKSWLKGDDNGMVLDTDGQMFDFAKAVFDAADYPNKNQNPPVSRKPINAQLLLTMIEKESGMILKRTRPTQIDYIDLTLLTGCGNPSIMRGPSGQIQCAARTLRNRFDELAACQDTPQKPPWSLQKTTLTRDGINVTPANASTGANFAYNPVAGIRWGGMTQKGGAARFCILWNATVQQGGFGFANPPTTLTLAPTNPTLTCSDPLGPPDRRNVTLSVSGGTPPYTWAVTTNITPTNATISACGTNGEDAVLKPPANNPNVGGRAYWLLAHSGASNVSCIVGATAVVGLRCDGVTQDTCFASTQNCVGAGCSTGIGGTCGPLICSDGPNCPGPSCGGDLMTYMMAHQSSAAAVDQRTQAMKDLGCKPCTLEMQGATVTVQDAAGAPVSTPVTVQ